jgi:trigger factor
VTVTIRKEEDDKRQLSLTVEVSEDQVEQAMRAKARQLARDLRIAGFRRGKAPYQVILQRVGAETVRAEAIEDMVQDVFEQALVEAEIEPYGRPVLENMELEPVIFVFTLPLEPVVTLGDYRALRKEIPAVEVTDEAVQEALEQVQTNHQTIEPVDRPVEVGDVVTIKGKGELLPAPVAAEEDETADEAAVVENEMLFDEESIDLLMDGDKLFAGTPFVDNLIGKSTGDEVSFGFVFPEDFEDEELAGREGLFEITILNVKSRELPAIDDELAKSEGDFETLDDLRADLREGLQREAEDQAREELLEQTITDLLADAELVYPPAALEMEIDDTYEAFKNQVTRSGWDVEDYLRLQGQTEESLREEFRADAEERLQRRLTLRQFILDEKLRVEAADVAELVEERVARYENEELRSQMRNYFMGGPGFDMISSEVLSNKVHERMVAILSGNAPDLAALEAEALAAEETEEE